ncbi:MAG: SpoIIIAH-like family protein [Clostridiales bacterium]|nr:SpoIIIAH-like family protein [Clostridiales bacterium]
MKLWKRNAVVAAIVLFVCAAVYLNWSYSRGTEGDVNAGKTLGEAALVGANTRDPLLAGGEGDAEVGAVDQSGYFASARLNRQQARDSALTLLQEAAADANAGQTVLDSANTAIQTMAAQTMAEAQIENLVTAKGYTDCVAFLGEESASIVVACVEGGLTETDTAKITEIVMEQTGLKAKQIKIIEADR